MRSRQKEDLATFRVYVGLSQSLRDDELNELRREFERCGRVEHFVCRPSAWTYAFVVYESTRDAVRAVRELDGRRVLRDERVKLVVRFSNPTPILVVRGLPEHSSAEEVKDMFRYAVRASVQKGDWAVEFDRTSDAQEAALRIQGRYDFDFVKEKERARSRSRERRRGVSRSPVREQHGGKSPQKRTRSRSPSRNEEDHVQTKRPTVEERIEALRLRPFEGTNVPAAVLEADVERVAKSLSPPFVEQEARSPAQIDPCPTCERLLSDLKQHIVEHHASGPVEIQKAVIRAWFESHYTRDSDRVGENPVQVARMTLLKEINGLLKAMGWPLWKTQSSLYKDWFLREVLGQSDDDIRKGRGWNLFYKDGFAPGGKVDNARNLDQRLADTVEKLRNYFDAQEGNNK